MARIDLKGLHHATAKLASGERVTYWYAWKGGPRLEARPGTPEFIAAFNAAVASRRTDLQRTDTLGWLLDKFQDSPEFTGTAESTRHGYRRHLGTIRQEFAEMTLAQLVARGSRTIFLEWRDEMAATRGTRTADYAFAVLARALSWAADREMIERNPCERAGRLHSGNRKDSVWTMEQERAFLESAGRPMRLAFLLALWTAQREGDILALTWRAYDGRSLLTRQSKGNVPVRIPVAGPLKAALDAERQANARKTSPSVQILTTDRGGRGYTNDGFRSSFAKACAGSGISGRTFHDLRGTFSTRASEAGATGFEISAITGHAAEGEGRKTALHTNYISMTYSMAESCIAKLEKWHESATKLQNGFQNGTEGALG